MAIFTSASHAGWSRTSPPTVRFTVTLNRRIGGYEVVVC
jgi:hypothetical protein